MKNLKLVLCIFVLYLLQNIICPILFGSEFTPELLLGFAVSYTVLESKFSKASAVIIITSLLTATGTGRVFSLVAILAGLAAVTAYIIKDYIRFIPQFVRTQAVIAVFAFIMCISEYFIFSKAMSVGFVLNTAIRYTVYTTIASCIIYLILKRTMFKFNDKKLLTA